MSKANLNTIFNNYVDDQNLTDNTTIVEAMFTEVYGYEVADIPAGFVQWWVDEITAGRVDVTQLAATSLGFVEAGTLAEGENADVVTATANAAKDAATGTDVAMSAIKDVASEAKSNAEEEQPADGGEGDTGETGTLTANIKALQEAQLDKSEYLTGTAAEIETVAKYIDDNSLDATVADDVETAVDNVYSTSIGALNTAKDTATTGLSEVGNIASTQSDNLNNALIEEQQGVFTKAVTEAQKLVNEKEGLDTAVNTVQTNQKSYIDTLDATKTATTALTGEVGYVNGAEGLSSDPILSTYTLTADAGEAVVTDTTDTDPVIVVGADGSTLEAANSTIAAYAGFSDLLSAAQAAYDAKQTELGAKTAIENAIATVLDIESPSWDDAVLSSDSSIGTVTDSDGSTVDLSTGTPTNELAVKDGVLYITSDDSSTVTYYTVTNIDVTGISSGVADANFTVSSTSTTSDPGVTALTAVGASPETTYDVEDEAQAFLKSGYVAADGSFAGTWSSDAPLAADLIAKEGYQKDFNDAIAAYEAAKATSETLGTYEDAISTAEEAFTDSDYSIATTTTAGSDNDVFIFDGTAASVTGFGVQGDDKLYFGSDYTVVNIESTDNLTTDRLGDSAAQEVFVQQSGSNLKLFFEETAFAGSAKSTDEIIEVQLTGISLDDVTIENGMVSMTEVA